MTTLERARQYLQAVERGATGAELAAFFTTDVEQEELPNRLSPKGATRGLAQILESAERGAKLMKSQRYAIRSIIADGDRVAMEVEWSGRLALPLPGLPAGEEVRAHLAIFLLFRGDRIAAQRNYDCFEPW